jgi:hypothetical protein
MNANNMDPPNSNSAHTFQYENLLNQPNWKKVTSVQHPQVVFYEKANKSNRRWSPPNAEENNTNTYVEYVENTNLPDGWSKIAHKQAPDFVYYHEDATGKASFRRPSGPVLSPFERIKRKIGNLQQTLQTMDETLKKAEKTPNAQAGGRVHRRHRHTVKRRRTVRRKQTRRA